MSWWDRNRSRVYEQRRQRYHTDASARTTQQQRCRNRREQKKREREKDKLPGYELTMLGLAYYATTSVSTLRRWIREGVIPEPYRFNHMFWFTLRQGRLIRDYAQTLHLRAGDRENARELLLLNWEPSA